MHVRAQATRMHRAVRTYLLTGDRAELTAYRQGRAEPFATLAAADRHATATTRRNLAEQDEQLRAYVSVADQQANAAPGSGRLLGLQAIGKGADKRPRSPRRPPGASRSSRPPTAGSTCGSPPTSHTRRSGRTQS